MASLLFSYVVLPFDALPSQRETPKVEAAGGLDMNLQGPGTLPTNDRSTYTLTVTNNYIGGPVMPNSTISIQLPSGALALGGSQVGNTLNFNIDNAIHQSESQSFSFTLASGQCGQNFTLQANLNGTVAQPGGDGPFYPISSSSNALSVSTTQCAASTLIANCEGTNPSQGLSLKPSDNGTLLITWRNIGNTPWKVNDGNSITFLPSFNGNPTVGGLQSMAIPQDIPVNGLMTYTVNFTAPSTPGDYVIVGQMTHNGQAMGTQLCGAPVHVAAPQQTDIATCIQPAASKLTFAPGESGQFLYTWRNTGNGTWKVLQGYALHFPQNADGTAMVSGLQDIGIPQDIPVGTDVTFTVNFTAPTTPGNYKISTDMRHNGQIFSDGKQCSLPLTVQAPKKVSDLSVYKTGPDSVLRGQLVTYTVTVTNNGPDTADSFTVTDNLPSGETYTNFQSDIFNCSSSNGTTVTCTGSNLAAYQSRSVLISAIVSANATCNGTLTNRATVTNANDTNNSNNSSTFPTRVDCPDNSTTLKADKSFWNNDGQTVTRGGLITYRLRVTNTGSRTATNVKATDTIPSLTQFQAGSSDSRCSISAGTVTCTAASIAAGSYEDFKVVVKVSDVADCNGHQDNSFSAVADNANVATSTSVSSIVSCPAQFGCVQIQKEIYDQNTNRLFSSVPAFTFKLDGVTTTVNDATGFATFQNVTMGSHTVSEMPLDGWDNFYLSPTNGVVNVTAGSCAGVVLKNRQVIAQPTNADVQITKDVSQTTLNRNGFVSYTIRVKNAGPASAQNVVVSDSIPSRITGLGVNNSQCSLAGSSMTCNFGTLANQDERTVTISGTVRDEDASCGLFSNTASVTSTTSDPSSGNNQASASATVSCQQQPEYGCIQITKEIYDQYNNRLYSSVPAFTFKLDGSQSTMNDASGNASFQNVPVGSHSISELSLNGWENFSTDPSNGTVTVTAGNSCATVKFKNRQVVVQPTNADVQITKDVSQTTLNRNGFVSYTIRVKNAGPASAQNVIVTDSVPSRITGLGVNNSLCSISGNSLTCNFGTLSNQDERTVTVSGTVRDEDASCGNFTNTASVTSTTSDPSSSNNQASASATVSCQQQPQYGCITIQKNVVDPNGNILNVAPAFTFKLDGNQTTMNDAGGHASFQNVTPGGHTVSEVSLDGWQQVQTTPAGGVINVSAGTSCATVTFKNQQVIPTADLTVTKTGPTSITRGQIATYTITVTNNGPGSVGTFTVTDTPDSNLSYTSFQSDFVACSPSGSKVICTGSNLAPNVPRNFTLSFLLSANASCNGTTTNGVTVSSSNDTNVSNNSSSFPSHIDCPITSTTLKADKSFWNNDGQTVLRGGLITYRLRVTNTGTISATNVKAIDTVPSMTQFQAGLSDSRCSVSAGTVTCTAANIATGAFEDFKVVVKVSDVAACDGQQVNSFSANADNATQVYSGSVTSTVSCPVQYGCVKIQKEIYDSNNNRIFTAVPSFTFKLDGNQTTVNDAAGNATFQSVPVGNHTISETPLSGWESYSMDPANGVLNVAEGNSCAVMTIRNRQVVQTTSADVQITKDVSTSSVNRNGTLTYTLHVKNLGPNAAVNVIANDSVPSRLTNLSVNNNQCSIAGSLVTCTFGTLQNQEERTVTITGTIRDEDASCGNFTNTASVNSATSDPNANNNQASASSTVACTDNADLRVTKTVSSTSVNRNGTLIYSLNVKNLGTATAQNVVLTDTVPARLMNLSVNNSQCSLNGSVVTCNFGTLLNQEERNVNITGTVRDEAASCGGFTNTASVVSSTADSVSANNTASVASNVQCDTGTLSISKTDGRTTVTPGEILTYTITLTNTSTTAATNVSVTDTLPTYEQYLSASDAPSVNGQNVTWNNLTVNASSTRTLTVQVLVSGSAPSGYTLLNNVQILNGASAQDTTVIQTTGGALSISKTDGRTTVAPGEVLTYTITLTNSSSATSSNVSVTDTLPTYEQYLSASDAPSVNGQSVTWNNLTVNANSTRTLTVQVLVNNSAPSGYNLLNTAQILNGASAQDSTVIQTTSGCTSNCTTNYRIDITDSPDPVRPDATLSYYTCVTNQTSVSSTTDVYQTIPSQTTYDSSSPNGTLTNSDRITWYSQNFNAYETKCYRLYVHVSRNANDGDQLRTYAYAGNAQDTETTQVIDDNSSNGRDLTLTITDSPDPVEPCGDLTYTIRLSNDSSSSRTVTLRADLDSNTEFDSASNGGREINSNEAQWTNLYISARGDTNVTLRVNVDCNAQDGDMLRLDASADNANDSENTRVIDRQVKDDHTTNNGDLTFTKSASMSTAQPGNMVTYTLTIRNNTGDDVSGINISDTFDSNQILMQNVGGGNLNGNQLTWNLGTLASGDSRILTYNGQLSQSLPQGTIVYNNATLTSDAGTRNASAQVGIIRNLPQTGAGDDMGPLENPNLFLRPFQANSAAGSAAPIAAGTTAVLTVMGAAGLLTRRFFF